MRVLVRVYSVLVLALSLLMLCMAVLDNLYGYVEEGKGFFDAFLVTCIMGMLMFLWGKQSAVDRRHVFILTTGSWLIIAFFASIPFYMIKSSMSYYDALFESISGITTTGATVISNLDNCSYGTLLWRAILHYIGGLGVVVSSIVIFPVFKNIKVNDLFVTESSSKIEQIFINTKHGIKVFSVIYIALTVVCFICYYFAGMNAFDAMCHAMSTISTGGFANYDNSIGYYDSAIIDYFAMLFMALSSLPLLVYLVFIGFKVCDKQIFWFAVILVSLFGLVVVSVHYNNTEIIPLNSEAENVSVIRYVAFTVIALLSTTGFVIVDYSNWGAGVLLLIVGMFIGGCSGSTTGGLKVFRLVLLYQSVRNYIMCLLQPHRVMVVKFGDVEYNLQNVFAYFIIYMFMFIVSSIILALSGIDLYTSVTAVVASITNSGPGMGDIVGPAGNYSSVNNLTKVVLFLNMMAGRLELITFVMFFVTFSRKWH